MENKMSKASTFRWQFCYGTLTAVGAIAMLCRLVYLWWYPNELDAFPGKKRLDLRFVFTQIKMINRWMLVWPLVGCVLTGASLLVLVDETKRRVFLKSYIRDVLIRWLLSYGLFMTFYLSFTTISGSREVDFDPSGHFACSLVAQAGHASYHLFLDKHSVCADEGRKSAAVAKKEAGKSSASDDV